MIPKQDRIKPRTVEDLERMYQFKAAKKQQTASETLAKESHQMASEAQQKAADSVKGLENKVDKTDDAQIVTMINRSTEIVKFLANRLMIESDNFKLSETGSVEAKDIKLSNETEDGEYSVKIEEGVLKVKAPRLLFAEGEPEQIDLFHFNPTPYGEVYKLFMKVHYDENFVFHLDGFGIAPTGEVIPVPEEETTE